MLIKTKDGIYSHHNSLGLEFKVLNGTDGVVYLLDHVDEREIFRVKPKGVTNQQINLHLATFEAFKLAVMDLVIRQANHHQVFDLDELWQHEILIQNK